MSPTNINTMTNNKFVRWAKRTKTSEAFLEVQQGNSWVYFKESIVYRPAPRFLGADSQMKDAGFATMQNALKHGYTCWPMVFIYDEGIELR